MRRKIELYINGSLADIATDALVLMNYKLTDSESPAAVYNSWSQSVVLPRTSKNNAIFDHIYRADHVTRSGKFNALARTPFVIYNEQGEILESGYLKLNDMSETQYNATLYGGLGGFLFGLMYNSDGSKRSLADMVYMSGGDEHEFDFNITRDSVRDAWRRVTGLDGNPSKWDYINFAPCYNGLPGGDFNSKRAFCPVTGIYGVTGSESGYTSRRDHVLVDLVNNVDEWAANDLRSYQQRPVVRMKAVIDAICAAANNGGYTVNLDERFFKNSNPYYTKLWLTLPKLDSIQLPNESGSGTGTFDGPNPGAQPTYTNGRQVDIEINGPWNTKGYTAKHDLSVTFVPTVLGSSQDTTGLAAWEKPVQPSGRTYRRVVTAYQLLALDQNGTVIGGSKVAMASTRTICSDGATPMETTVAPATFVQKYNNALSTHWNQFTPAWTPEDGDVYDSSMYNGAKYMNTGSGRQLVDSSNDPVEVTLSFSGVAGISRVMLRTTYICIYSDGGVGIPYYQDQRNEMGSSDASATMTFTSLSFNGGEDSYSYSVSGTAHSGSEITKQLLLGGTQTPADYLLSFCKMFGLLLTYNSATKEVGVLTRQTFFNGNGINLEGKIDLPSRRNVPYAVSSRWYEWTAGVNGRFADYYRDVYNKEYGMARVNTGFEFDGSHNDVLKGCIFKGAAEVLHNNKYFVRIKQNSKDVPSPFIDGGKYSLWNGSGEAKQFDIVCPDNSATIEYVNQYFPGYDYTLLPKPEFCDKDNKAVGGEDVLLMYNGRQSTSRYSRYTITDDNGLMTLYNEGAPCYLLGQWTIAANKKYTVNNDDGGDSGSFNRSFSSSFDTGDNSEKLYMPRFRRMTDSNVLPMVITHSLDFAVPSEIDQPAISCAADKAVYQRGWANYITDKMNVDTKVMTCKVDLRGLQVGQDLLRNFYYFEGCWWVLNQIKNYVVGGDDLTECEFIKVNDKTNYTNGQTY